MTQTQKAKGKPFLPILLLVGLLIALLGFYLCYTGMQQAEREIAPAINKKIGVIQSVTSRLQHNGNRRKTVYYGVVEVDGKTIDLKLPDYRTSGSSIIVYEYNGQYNTNQITFMQRTPTYTFGAVLAGLGLFTCIFSLPIYPKKHKRRLSAAANDAQTDAADHDQQKLS